MRVAYFLPLLLATMLGGCIDPIDQQWQLDHDHVVVARATPPRIRPGDMTNLDALVAHAGGPTTVESPMDASVAQTGYAAQLVHDGAQWKVIAPDATTLAAARGGMGLADDAPVPVDVMMSFAVGTNRALDPVKVRKTVWLGEPAVNPDMPAITVADAPFAGDSVVVPKDKDVYLAVEVPTGWHVNWLTSAGQLWQDDEPRSFIHIAPKDRQQGELACVIRDTEGGVVWKVWPISAQ